MGHQATAVSLSLSLCVSVSVSLSPFLSPPHYPPLPVYIGTRGHMKSTEQKRALSTRELPVILGKLASSLDPLLISKMKDGLFDASGSSLSECL